VKRSIRVVWRQNVKLTRNYIVLEWWVWMKKSLSKSSNLFLYSLLTITLKYQATTFCLFKLVDSVLKCVSDYLKRCHNVKAQHYPGSKASLLAECCKHNVRQWNSCKSFFCLPSWKVSGSWQTLLQNKVQINLGWKVVLPVWVGFHCYVCYGFFVCLFIFFNFNCVTKLIGFTSLLRVKNKQKRISQDKFSVSKYLEKTVRGKLARSKGILLRDGIMTIWRHEAGTCRSENKLQFIFENSSCYCAQTPGEKVTVWNHVLMYQSLHNREGSSPEHCQCVRELGSCTLGWGEHKAYGTDGWPGNRGEGAVVLTPEHARFTLLKFFPTH